MATWKAACCAVQGRGHLQSGIPCQDKVFQQCRNGVYAIALADGAGSASLSHFGAECIVHKICAYLTNRFNDLFSNEDGRQVKRELLGMMRAALELRAAELECGVKDLASTVLAAAVLEERYIFAHIGDGVIGCLKDDELTVASAPDNGEFSNVTTFVTSGEALSSMRLFKGHLDHISAFVLMSDGTEQSLYHKPTKTLAGVVVKLMQRTCLIDSSVMETRLENALASVVTQNTQDDCSIAILARPEGALRPLEQLTGTERCELFRISPGDQYSAWRLRWYGRILKALERPRTVQQISRKIQGNRKRAGDGVDALLIRKYLDNLLDSGLITKKGACYSRI